MNYIEAKIIAIGKWLRAVDIYCCRLDKVLDLAERPMTAQVAMRCRYHDCFSFEVVYGQMNEQQDSALIRQISAGIVENRNEKKIAAAARI